MEIELRLRKVFAELGVEPHGVVQKIARDLGVHRHTISRLYHNEATHPSLKVLERLCEWLRERGMPADQLPQALFGARPSALFEAMAAPGKVGIHLGQYEEEREHQGILSWVSRFDLTAAGEFVQALSMPGEGYPRPMVFIRYVPFRFVPIGTCVKETQLLQDQVRAREIFRQIFARKEGGSTVIVGSQLTNYLTELLVAHLFGTTPFKTPARTFRVPFFLVFRSKHRAVPSCFGGTGHLPGTKEESAPGIYYLDAKRKWVCCPWKQDDENEDAGIVTVVYEPGMGVQMGVLGFSGHATEALARQFLLDASPFWKSQVSWHGRKVGVYICRFRVSVENSPDAGEVTRAKDLKVIPLSRDILQERLAGSPATWSKTSSPATP